MTFATQPTDISTAPKYLKGATDVTLRQRLLPRFLDEEGRITRDATGKDLNWLIKYKLPVAVPYVQGQPLNFSNDNFNLVGTVTPEFMVATSGMNFTEVLMNSGPTQIVNNLLARGPMLLEAMQVKFAKDLYSDANVNLRSIIGLGTLVRRSTTLVCTNADRIAVPLAGTTYAGLQLAPGSYGGGWSNNNVVKMSTVLGTDWPDGQGTPDQIYDCTTPRLYNNNSNQWLTPGAAAANGTWAANCLAMLSRANTDLSMNSVKTMMPNIHLSGAERTQNIKDQLRVSFRDTMMNNKAAENLGYYTAYNYEGAAIDVDHECPSDRTFSVCAASMDLFFYSNPAEAGGKMSVGDNSVTGGIFFFWGPTMVPGTLDYAWIMAAGGNARYNPKWVCCHKDFTTGV